MRDTPNTPNATQEILCKCSAPIQTRPERPCPIHMDMIFQGGSEPARVDSIVFRNHYVASISISQRQLIVDASGNKTPAWVSVLRDERLMKHPHFEDDAQSPRTLYTSRFLPSFDARLCAGQGGEPEDMSAPFDAEREPPIGSLRFKLRQPSMMWSNCMELRNLRCFMFKPMKNATWTANSSSIPSTPTALPPPSAEKLGNSSDRENSDRETRSPPRSAATR